MSMTAVVLKPRFTVVKGGTLKLMARVEGWNAQPLKQVDIESIEYSIFEVNKMTGREDVVEGHDAVAVEKTDIISDTLRTDADWEDRDSTGYNFYHTPPNRDDVPFPNRGKTYEVRYTIVPANAAEQNLVIAFEVTVE